jgi:hypothetical protein
MSILYRILERTDTGESAELVRRGFLERYAYPTVLLKEALDRFHFTCSTMFGFERIAPEEYGTGEYSG